MGEAWAGWLNPDCEGGEAQQTSNSSHLHWVIPKDKFIIDGWVFDYPNKCFYKGTDKKCSSSTNTVWFTSNNDGLCIPPSNEASPWLLVGETCTITGTMNIKNNVFLVLNSSLILNNASVNFNFKTNRIIIDSSSKIRLDKFSKLY